MIFNSLEFMIFLPIVFFIYWFVCKKNKTLQNYCLLLASLHFYAWWDWHFLWLIIATVLSTFIAGYLCSQHSSLITNKLRGGVFWVAIIINLGILVYYKYSNFFIQSFVDSVRLFGAELSVDTLQIVLPIGLSFYTFTALSYLIDVYTNKIEPTKDFVSYATYVAFFPALFCGPIGRATKQLPQYFEKRTFDYSQAVVGARMLLWGMFLKLCVADRIGIYVDSVYGDIIQNNGTSLLIAAMLYSLQIYADFGGYSYMAIGVGKLLGIELQTNFERPYFAKTVTEFWKRWHISLTSWFRDYIYIPLGGNRVSQARWMTNTMIVFLISGLWHGAAYNFIIWGGLHGLLLIVEKKIYGKRLKDIGHRLTAINCFRIALTFVLVTVAWIFFRLDFANAVTVISKIFSDFGLPYIGGVNMAFIMLCTCMLICADYMMEYKSAKLQEVKSLYRFLSYLLVALMIVLFGVFASNSQFIYFQF